MEDPLGVFKDLMLSSIFNKKIRREGICLGCGVRVGSGGVGHRMREGEGSAECGLGQGAWGTGRGKERARRSAGWVRARGAPDGAHSLGNFLA